MPPSIWLPCRALTLYALLVSSAFAQTPVSVARVESQAITSTLQLNANLVAFNETIIASEVSARVKKVFFEAGDEVDTGQLLIQLDDTQQRLLLTQATAVLQRLEAEVKLAQLDEKRLARLLRSKSVSQEQYDQAIAKTQQAVADVSAQQASVALAEDTLKKYAIHAPFDGIVSSKLANIGTLLQSGNAITTLTAIDPLKVEIGVPQRYFGLIRENATLELAPTTLQHEERNVSLPVETVIARTDNNRLFTIWAKLENSQRLWTHGMSAKATVRWQTPNGNHVVVPSDAILQKPDGSQMLWKVTTDAENNNAVEPINVQVKAREGKQVSILTVVPNALLGGDMVVVNGNEALQPGQQVSYEK